MTDLFKKLNVLVKAGLGDLLGDVAQGRSRTPAPGQLGKNIDREIAGLRRRINEALDHEDRLKAQVQKLEDEIAGLDARADQAVTNDNDAEARYLIEQMQRVEQRLAMAESDLHEHQIVTQELILRVNEMEAWVEDAKRAQREAAADAAASAEKAAANNEAIEDGSNTLSGILKRAQDTIGNMGDLIAKSRQDHDDADAGQETREKLERTPTSSSAPRNPKVEDDLEQRRQRLSKR
jgi:phage shock protein A